MGRPDAINERAETPAVEDYFAAIRDGLQRGARAGEQQLAQAVDVKADPKDGKVTIDQKNFDKIGPKAKGVLDGAGVSEITIAAGKNEDTVEAVLAKPHEIPRNLLKDGCSKLTIDTKFSAKMEKDSNGTLILKDIKGLTATTLFGVLDVTRLEMKLNAAGDTEINSTVAGFVSPKVEPGSDVMKKAETLRERIKALKPEELKPPNKKVGNLNVPTLFVG